MVCVEVAEGREQAWSEVRSDGLKEVIGEHRLLHGSEVRGARWRFTGPPMTLAGALSYRFMRHSDKIRQGLFAQN